MPAVVTQTFESWCGPSIVCTGDFIRSPFIYQCDLTEAPAVRQLASDPAYSGLHKLLTVMLAGDITGEMIPTYWTGLCVYVDTEVYVCLNIDFRCVYICVHISVQVQCVSNVSLLFAAQDLDTDVRGQLQRCLEHSHTSVALWCLCRPTHAPHLEMCACAHLEICT